MVSFVFFFLKNVIFITNNFFKDSIFKQAILSFRLFCLKNTSLPDELQFKLYDLCNNYGNLFFFYFF